MADFIASPFMLVMFACAYIASFITGRTIIIAEVQDDDE